MSDMSNLSELVQFIGQPALRAQEPVSGRASSNALAARLVPRVQRRGVGDLLGAVLALSARTRRMILPIVDIELDVFAPNGSRAVRMTLQRR